MPNIGTLAVLMARGTIGLMPQDARAAAAAIGWKSVENMLQKAAIGEALTGFSTTSGTGTDLTGFVTSLRGLSLTAEVAARAQHWPINSRIGVLPESGYIAAEITEDSNVAPVFLSNGIVLIKPGKVSAIVAYSEELLNTNGAAAAIEDDLRKAISRELDKALLSRIQPGSSGGFSATSSAPADIKTLVGMISVTGAEPLVFGAAVDVNLAAATLYQDGEEVFEEVNLVGMGAYKGVPWLPVEVGKILEMINALLPRVSAPATTAPEMGGPMAEQETAEPDRVDDLKEWTDPQPDWTLRNYEIAYMHATWANDLEITSQLEEAYLKTAGAAQECNATNWKAFCEYRRIIAGRPSASLTNLKTIAESDGNCTEALYYLAKGYVHYGSSDAAAATFEAAAAAEVETESKIRWLGEAVGIYARSGQPTAVSRVVDEMKNLVTATGKGELQLLRALCDVAEVNGSDEQAAFILERIVELDPSNTNTRFTLAYKYSKFAGDYEIPLWHYLKIPLGERTQITWNNLGVAYDRLSLPIKAVAAYQRAKELGETLAMSNLANKFLDAGFVGEAQSELNAAILVGNCHRNVGASLAQLTDTVEEEEKKETKVERDVEIKSSFYRQFGRSVGLLEPTNLGTEWQGPDCKLQITVQNDKFEAIGSYERRGLAGLLFGGGQQAERYTVTYRGTISGRAVQARVSKVRDGETPKPTSLLSLEQEPKALMIIAEDGHAIKVMEFPQIGQHRFYSLTALGQIQKT